MLRALNLHKAFPPDPNRTVAPIDLQPEICPLSGISDNMFFKNEQGLY